MTKSKSEDVKVRLSCIYSGAQAFSSGDVITVDAKEAERLVGLGVGEIVK